MNKASEIMSDITVHMKYARYLSTKNRRETWEELVNRNKEMHLETIKQTLGESIEGSAMVEALDSAYEYVYAKEVLPSMRSLQFGGKPIALSPNRMYNCAYMPIDNIAAFPETMFLLLGGTGVGYSVQKHHVEKLPPIYQPIKKTKRWKVGDSIEGWADSIKAMMKSYTNAGSRTIVFDYSDVRPKGARLVTSGGKAPSSAPLEQCLVKIKHILTEKRIGTQLSTVEVHDILCHIADAVLAGGIRRAALISLFSADDTKMIESKSGSWWELNPQRGRANNSAVLLRHRVTKEFFMELWKRIELSGAGEPAIYLSNDKDWGTNPCCEIALRPFQFCNLTEVNVKNVSSQEDLNKRVAVASFIGTLQASYTDFHYLRDIWKETTEKEALIGVSMTGIGANKTKDLDLEEAAEIVKDTNEKYSNWLGINSAARTTCVKPAGTTSCVLGTSSGIHAYHNDFYIRRIRLGKNEAIYTYLINNHPDMIEDDYFNSETQGVISIPQRAPKNSIMRTESPIDLLDRVKNVSENWVKTGHIAGQNTHNVSATISVKENEWKIVGEWLWDNRDYYNGLSVLPYDGGTYVQAPFEDCSEYQYKKMMKSLSKIDLTQIIEWDDNTNLTGELACAGGQCEI
tara:strand:+ start:1623 stop:3506 length:1884 start_codon:yes stop_codon:yes gene_type:complete